MKRPATYEKFSITSELLWAKPKNLKEVWDQGGVFDIFAKWENSFFGIISVSISFLSCENITEAPENFC